MAEPITLTEAKQHLRMENDSSQDTFITSLIAPARAFVERRTGYSFVSGARVFTFARWGDYLEIYLRPITSVTTVAYTDEEGDAATYTSYLAPLGIFPFRIFHAVGDEFPTLAEGTSITVTVAAGAVDSASQEYLIGKRAMLLLIGHWLEARETVVIGDSANEVPFAVECLLDELGPLSAY